MAPHSEAGGTDMEVQRRGLEALRNSHPGMLIDHIEEPPGTDRGVPAKRRPHLVRLRSHAEARTFDELRVHGIGLLVKAEDPDYHKVVLELVYGARAILLDSAGFVADPADERGIHTAPGHAEQAGPPAVSAAVDAPARSTRTEHPAVGPPPHHADPARPRPPAQAMGTGLDPPKAAQRSSLPPRQPRWRRAVRGGARPQHPRLAAPFTALCEGRIFCGQCGAPAVVQSLGRELQRYYTCSARHLHPTTESSPEVYFPIARVDEAVWHRLAQRLQDLDTLLESARASSLRQTPLGKSQQAEHERRLANLDRDEAEVRRLVADARISHAAAQRRLEAIVVERREQEELSRDAGGTSFHLLALMQSLESVLAEQPRRQSAGARSWPAPLRQQLLRTSIPDSAEYGIHLQDDGSIEVQHLLSQLKPARSATVLSSVNATLSQVGQQLGALRRGLEPEVREGAPRVAQPDAPRAKLSLKNLVRRRSASEVVRPTSWLTYGVLIAISLSVAIVLQPETTPVIQRDNLVLDLGYSGVLTELHRVPGGWIGSVVPTWPGLRSPVDTMDLCEDIEKQLAPGERETITLLVPGGIPVAECGPPVDYQRSG